MASPPGAMPPPLHRGYTPAPRAAGGPTLASPTPHKVTKLSTKYRRTASPASRAARPSVGASAAAQQPASAARGGSSRTGGAPPAPGQRSNGQRSNPATPLFSPDTDEVFRALAGPAAAPASGSQLAPAEGPARLSEPAAPPPAAVPGAPAADEEVRDLSVQLAGAAADSAAKLRRSSLDADLAAISADTPAQEAAAAAARVPAKMDIVESIAVAGEAQLPGTVTSPPSQQAAHAEGCSPSPNKKFWKEMSAELQAAAELMGWTGGSWDEGDRAPFKAIWADMSAQKQSAARLFNFGPADFAKPKQLPSWKGYPGWSYRRGTGLVTYVYIAPDGREFDSEEAAQKAVDAMGVGSGEPFSPAAAAPSAAPSDLPKPSPPRESTERSPILSPQHKRSASSTSDPTSAESGLWWRDMNPEQQNAAQMLGWTCESWDAGDESQFLQIWAEMSDEQHAAAFALNFDESTFAKPKKPKKQTWVGHAGWSIRRGTGLITWVYTSPNGREFTSEEDALVECERLAEVGTADDEVQMTQADNENSMSGAEELQTGKGTEHAAANRSKRKRDQPAALPAPAEGTAAAPVAATQAPAASPKAVGDTVEANYLGRGAYEHGTITKANDDGTFGVKYHDGDFEANVERVNIRAVTKRRRVPRTDLDNVDKRSASASAAKAEKSKVQPKTKKLLPSKPKQAGPSAADRKLVSQALRGAADAVMDVDNSIDNSLGWLWSALAGYSGQGGMHLLKHIEAKGRASPTKSDGNRRFSALFSPTSSQGTQQGAPPPAGTPRSDELKDFLWERLDGEWRQLPDGKWRRDGLVVLWTPSSLETFPKLEDLTWQLKNGEDLLAWFKGADGAVHRGREGKDECFIFISEEQLQTFGEVDAELSVWNNNGTPDAFNDSKIKLEGTVTGLSLVPRSGSASYSQSEATFPPAGGLQVEMRCDALDDLGDWHPVKIKQLRKGQARVHFIGWHDRHDCWISVDDARFAPEKTLSTGTESAAERWGSGTAESGNDDDDDSDEEELEISAVLQAQTTEDGEVQYKVRLKGRGASEDMWIGCAEIEANGAEHKLEKFKEKEAKKAERKAAAAKKKADDAKKKADAERRKEQAKQKREQKKAEKRKEEEEAHANAELLVEQKRKQLAGLAASGTKRKHSSALTDTSNGGRSQVQGGEELIGRRLVRLNKALTKGKVQAYNAKDETYEILFKDGDDLTLTMEQILHGGFVQ